ncbi:phage late control protein GPD [compost metagenome]
MLEVMTDDKKGNVFDISELVTDASWKTSRIGKPGSLDLTLLQASNYKINNGDIIRAKWDGKPLFYGYVFVIGRGEEETFKVKAYDQIRYLSSNDTYVVKNITAAALLKQIAKDFGLKVGSVADTKYKIPSMIEDNQKLIDIISKALDYTVINTGNIFVLYDDFGNLVIKDSKNMRLDLLIGDDSLMTGFSFERSIDSDTYNRVKLVQDNKKSKKREVYIAQDSANIGKWGRLQLMQKVDDNKNAAQIKQLLDQLIKLKNRETKTLKLDALGDPSVRAGCYVPIEIQELGINQYYLVDECTHKISGNEYTMSLELKVI